MGGVRGFWPGVAPAQMALALDEMRELLCFVFDACWMALQSILLPALHSCIVYL
jgi:hypothetical protein